MKTSVIVFPGSNCDRDVAVALAAATGSTPKMVWHGDTQLPKSDLIVLPGGFSYGDYLRSGAIAAHSPIMRDLIAHARKGIPVLGICNGFQVLTEVGLLPGVLMRNTSLNFACREVSIRVERNDTLFTSRYRKHQLIRLSIAHKDGNYFADSDKLRRLEGDGQIAFRYADDVGQITLQSNPNGSVGNIAGIYDKAGTVLGLMPHPERHVDKQVGGVDGAPLFEGLCNGLAR